MELRKVKIARLQAPDGHSVYRTDKTAADQLPFFSRAHSPPPRQNARRRLGFQEGRQLHTQSGILERENLNRELYLTVRGADGVKECMQHVRIPMPNPAGRSAKNVATPRSARRRRN